MKDSTAEKATGKAKKRRQTHKIMGNMCCIMSTYMFCIVDKAKCNTAWRVDTQEKRVSSVPRAIVRWGCFRKS